MTLPFRQQSLCGYVVLAADPVFTRPARPQPFRNRPRHGRRLVARHVENERRSATRLDPSVSIKVVSQQCRTNTLQVYRARRTIYIARATSRWKYGRAAKRRQQKVCRCSTSQGSIADWHTARKRSEDIKFDLPPLMEGVENDLDRSLLQHFANRASAVLTLHGDKATNPFTKILLPMALEHEGLMHSVLCLSASHMYSINPSQEYEDRQAFHRGKALQLLKHDLERQKAGEGGVMVYEDSNVAQILLHLLHSICDGNTSGEYRMHMVAAKQIAMSQNLPTLSSSRFSTSSSTTTGLQVRSLRWTAPMCPQWMTSICRSRLTLRPLVLSVSPMVYSGSSPRSAT